MCLVRRERNHLSRLSHGTSLCFNGSGSSQLDAGWAHLIHSWPPPFNPSIRPPTSFESLHSHRTLRLSSPRLAACDCPATSVNSCMTSCGHGGR